MGYYLKARVPDIDKGLVRLFLFETNNASGFAPHRLFCIYGINKSSVILQALNLGRRKMQIWGRCVSYSGKQ